MKFISWPSQMKNFLLIQQQQKIYHKNSKITLTSSVFIQNKSTILMRVFFKFLPKKTFATTQKTTLGTQNEQENIKLCIFVIGKLLKHVLLRMLTSLSFCYRTEKSIWMNGRVFFQSLD